MYIEQLLEKCLKCIFNLLLEIHCWLKKQQEEKSYKPVISNMLKVCRDTGSCKQVIKYWWQEIVKAQNTGLGGFFCNFKNN